MGKGLGTRLILQITVALFVVMSIFGVWGVYQQRGKYAADLEKKEQDIITPLSYILGNLLFDLDHERIRAVLHSYLAAQDMLAMKITDDKNVMYYVGKMSENDTKIVDFLKQKGAPPVYGHFHVQTISLQHESESLGTLEVTFSRKIVDEEIRRVIIGVVLSFLIVVVVESLLIVILLRRNVTIPLRILTRIARQIAEGNFHIQLPLRNSHDEIGVFTLAFKSMISYIQTITHIAGRISNGDLQHAITPKSANDMLGKAFQEMSDYLRDMAVVATEIANGDLRREIQPKTEHDILGLAFQNMKRLRQSVGLVIEESEQLRAASGSLTGISSKMAAIAERTSQQVHSVSLNNQQVNDHVNEISTAIEEFAASIRDIALNSAHVKEIVTSALSMSKKANTTILELEQHSQEIGQISKVITAITQQTNLLALNATIESARAGESGMGFAVVAREVKELSKEIASSAGDITRRIDAIQRSTTSAVDVIGQIGGITEQVYQIATEIVTAVEEQVAVADEIVMGVNSVAHGSDQIMNTMGEVTETVRESSSQAIEVQQAAQALGQLANDLQQAVSVFKI